jgi:hypothetical protein
VLGAALALVGCSSENKSLVPNDGAVSPDSPPGVVPASIGAHSITFQRYQRPDGKTLVSTPPMSTQASGSLIIVAQGRGAFSAFAPPTDNKGNAPYQALDIARKYTNYPDSGTALYVFPNAQGGSGHIISATTPSTDEITLIAVEVKGGTVKDVSWNEALKGTPTRSKKVTTTGPATLIAFWWGDAPPPSVKTAVPNNGFTVINSVLEEGELVQSAVAVKEVTAAGDYDVTWTATPAQGAQLWLIAVQ